MIKTLRIELYELRERIAKEIEAEHNKCIKQDGIMYCTHLESALIVRGKNERTL